MLPFVTNNEIYRYYKILNPEKDVIPDFLISYCMTPSVSRLEGVGYFCGADYHKMIGYQPKYFYSRFDHSLACALIIWNKTHNREQCILALLHDIGTPCFSHAIDYGMKDSEKQESSERNIVDAIEEDQMLKELLYLDGIDYQKIDLKRESLVDNKRPKLCADRLEGIFSSNLIWSQKISLKGIKKIYSHIQILREDGKIEFGFDDEETAKHCFFYNQEINNLTESKEDILAMSLLGDIMMYAVNSGCITKEELYHLTEYEMIDKIKSNSNTHLKHYFNTYCSLTEVNTFTNGSNPNHYHVSDIKLKKRQIDPLVETEEEGAVRLSQINPLVSQFMIEYENDLIMEKPCIKLLWKQKRK